MLRWLVAQAVRNTSQQAVQDAAEEAVRTAQETTPQILPLEMEEFPAADVLVLFALSVEAGPFVERLEEGRRFRWQKLKGTLGKLEGRYVAVMQTGVGKRSVARFIDRVAPALSSKTACVSAGFAGALVPELGRGDLLMPNQITDGKRSFTLPMRVSQETIDATSYLHTGCLLTVDHIVATQPERAALAEQHGAVACDMESAEVAAGLQRFGRDVTSVRIISDGVDDDIPEEVSKLLSQASFAAKMGAATGALFQRPSVAKDLWKLRDQAGRAANRLAGFLTGVVTQVQ